MIFDLADKSTILVGSFVFRRLTSNYIASVYCEPLRLEFVNAYLIFLILPYFLTVYYAYFQDIQFLDRSK